MASRFSDFLFGSGALKKAAAQGDPAGKQPTQPEQPAGLDIAKMAQDQADRAAADALAKKKKKPTATDSLQKGLAAGVP